MEQTSATDATESEEKTNTKANGIAIVVLTVITAVAVIIAVAVFVIGIFDDDAPTHRVLGGPGTVSLQVPTTWDAFLRMREDGILAVHIFSEYGNVFMESWISREDMDFILDLEISLGAVANEFIFADGGVGYVLRIEDYHFREVLFLNEKDGAVLVYVVATAGYDDWIERNIELIYSVASTLTIYTPEAT